MHFAIFAVPLSIAVKFGISLIVWGENSAVQYGGGVDDKPHGIERSLALQNMAYHKGVVWKTGMMRS